MRRSKRLFRFGDSVLVLKVRREKGGVVVGSNRDSSLLFSMVMKGMVVRTCWFFEDVEVRFESLELANLCFAGALRMTECESPFTTKQTQIMTRL